MSEKQAEWLTPDEAADLLRVNRETIYRQIRRGALPATRVGRVYRISREALLRGRGPHLAETPAVYSAKTQPAEDEFVWRKPPDFDEIVALEDDVEFIRRSAGLFATGRMRTDEELEAEIEEAHLEDLRERMKNW